MKTLVISAVAVVLGVASIASADRGDRHYPGRGGDRYDRQRQEASIRYERGSRNYDSTYARYGQDDYSRRPSYDRDYVRRSNRGDYYDRGRTSRSNWGFSLGYSSGYGYGGDSVSIGVRYSNRPSVTYYGGGYGSWCAPEVYERRTRVYAAYEPVYAPTVYEYRSYSVPRGYYSYGYGSYSVRGGGGYYCR